jgi:thiamine biosynthesis lipoprotein
MIGMVLTIGLAGIQGCTDQRAPISRQSTAMNTYISVTIYDQDVGESVAQALIDTAFFEIQRIEAFATDYSDTSEVGRINSAAGMDSVEVSGELIALVRKGIEYGDLSGGKLDITIGQLVKAWNFIGEHPRALTVREVDSLLKPVDYRKLVVSGTQVFLPSPGMRLDLGSIGKGYAIDRAVEKLKNAGLKRFIVDIGGKLGVYFQGTTLLDSTAAEILVRHPRKDGGYFGRFKVGTGAVSTSGDYQRFFMENGVRYHHLLDPSTGFPVRGLVAVTVVTQDALTGDALSTLVFLLGKEKGMEFIRKTPGLEGMIIYEEADSLKFEISEKFSRQFMREEM